MDDSPRLSRAMVVMVVLLVTIVSVVLATIFVLWSRGVTIQLEVQSPRRSEERRAAAYWAAGREFLRLGREFAHVIESRANKSACREAVLRFANAADEWRKLHREAQSPGDDYRQLDEMIFDRLAQAAALEDALNGDDPNLAELLQSFTERLDDVEEALRERNAGGWRLE